MFTHAGTCHTANDHAARFPPPPRLLSPFNSTVRYAVPIRVGSTSRALSARQQGRRRDRTVSIVPVIQSMMEWPFRHFTGYKECEYRMMSSVHSSSRSACHKLIVPQFISPRVRAETAFEVSLGMVAWLGISWHCEHKCLVSGMEKLPSARQDRRVAMATSTQHNGRGGGNQGRPGFVLSCLGCSGAVKY